MKLRYIISSFIAAVAILAGCTPEQIPVSSLDGLTVSNDFFSLTADEGSTVTITLSADEAWTIDTNADWLVAEPSSGSAGQAVNVTFRSLSATDATRKTEVKISMGSKTKILNVQQFAVQGEPEILTVDEALNLIYSDSYSGGFVYVKGIVCKIVEISPSYGNATYFLSDDGTYKDGSWLEVYRGKWINGENFTKGDEFAVGDELTIYSSLVLYNGVTPETNQGACEVVSIKKSLIDVEPFTFEQLPYTDTTFNMVVTAKESPLLVTSDSDWLKIVDINEDGSYKLEASENPRTGKRTAAISVKGPTALKSIEVVQAGAPSTGSSVTEIIAAADNDEVRTLPTTLVVALTTNGAVLSDGQNAVFAYGNDAAKLKIGDGVSISATKTTYNGVPELKDFDASDIFVDSEGNTVAYPDAKDITSQIETYAAATAEYIKFSGTLNVSADGKYYNMDFDGIDPNTKQGSIYYPAASLDANSWNGKKITVTGYFNGISGKGKFVNIIATKISEFVDNPKGTLRNPYDATELAGLIKAGNIPEGKVYVRGIINKIDNINIEKKNAQYWLSTDGTTADFEAYRSYYYGGADWTEENQDAIKVGDEVVLCGEPTYYAQNDVAEFKQGNYLVTINGKALPEGDGTEASPYNVTKLAEMILAGEAPSGEVYAKGLISQIDNVNLSFGNAQYWISDDGSKLFQMEIYRGFWFNGDKFTSEDQISLGDEVVVYGKVKLYNDTTPEFDANNKIISLNGKTE